MPKGNAKVLTGVIIHGGMAIEVTVLEVKQAYGRTRYLVTPVTGSGSMWTEQVTMDGPGPRKEPKNA